MAEKTPEDRRHDIALLVYGFFLTTVAGTAITFVAHYFDEERAEKATQVAQAIAARDAKEAQNSTLREQRRAAATNLFDELVPLIDKRMFRTRQVLWALNAPEINRRAQTSISAAPNMKRLTSARAAYREVVQEWNLRLNRNRSLLCRFFGREIDVQFESALLTTFIQLHVQLRAFFDDAKMAKPSSDRTRQLLAMEAMLDLLNHGTYQFSNQMAEAIRKGDVGSDQVSGECFTPDQPEDL
jgi:hypothetical protein